MYPTLSYLVHDLTGLNVNLPVPTFGFVMALSFWAAYGVFMLEFRRRMGPSFPTRRLMDTLLLACGLLGFGGAVLLAAMESPHGFHYNGLNYYGGLIFGALTYLFITRRKGIPLAVAADIGSPGMMLAYGLGRIGCHLSGDGDWGILHTTPKPAWIPGWAWGCRYPHNVLHQGAYIPGCGGAYCTELVDPVYPTPLYEAVVCLLLFSLLWGLRRRITRPGLLFALFAFLVGTERFLIEFIRVTPRYAFLGLSQAQYISLGLTGLSIFVYFYALKLSPTDKIVHVKTYT
jgi:phosphatidylglycerol:prolipoprotein diacylglycerol transferase